MKTILTYLGAFALFMSTLMADSNVSATQAGTPIQETSYRVSLIDSTTVPTWNFRVKNEGGASTIHIINFIFSGSVLPTTAYLYDGGTLLASSSLSYSEANLTFELPISDGEAKELTLKATYNASANGKWSRPELGWIHYTNSDGFEKNWLPYLSLLGPAPRFFLAVENWSVAAMPTIQKTSDANGWTTSMSAIFPLQVFANGGNFQNPTPKDFVVVATSGMGSEIICPSISVSVIPSGSNIADGTIVTVVVVAQITAADIAKSDNYRFEVRQINSKQIVVGGASQIAQTWGLGSFKTPNPQVFLKNGGLISQPIRCPQIGNNLYDNISNAAIGGEAGYPGQVKGEGQWVSVSADLNPFVRWVVIPDGSSEHGQSMQVDATVTATQLTPHVSAIYGASEYQLFNSNVTVDGFGVAQMVTFEVHAGGQIEYGTAIRTGETSCLVKFYWGNGASYTSPGEVIDLLNLSPGTAFNDGTKQYPAGPLRFKMDLVPRLATNTLLTLDMHVMPDSYNIQASSNLTDWKYVSYSYGYDASGPDSTGSVGGYVTVDKSTLPQFGIDPTRVFFRIVLNQ